MLEKRNHLAEHGDHLRRPAPRAARLPRHLLQPAPAAHPPGGRRRVRDGAGREPGHERLQHDLHGDRAFNEGLVAVTEPTTEPCWRPWPGSSGSWPRSAKGRRAPSRSKRARLCRAPRRAGRGTEIGTVTVDVAWGGDVLRHRRGGRAGAEAHAGRRAGHRSVGGDGEGRQGAASRRPPGDARVGRDQHHRAHRPAHGPGAHAKNTVVVSSGTLDWSRPESFTGVLDRSPCGTGTCARMAVLHARGQLTSVRTSSRESWVPPGPVVC